MATMKPETIALNKDEGVETSWLIGRDGDYGIERRGEGGEVKYYMLYCWVNGVHVCLNSGDLYEFMEVMTNEENQKKMKDEMGVIQRALKANDQDGIY
jgi:hypothetical protein